MSFWKTPALLMGTFGSVGMILGGTIFAALLSPKNPGACASGIQSSIFDNPCLNVFGMNASGFDPSFLFVLGAFLVGGSGALIGWLSSKGLNL